MTLLSRLVARKIKGALLLGVDSFEECTEVIRVLSWGNKKALL